MEDNMKFWKVYNAGGEYRETIGASCITKAARAFMSRLPRKTSLQLDNREQGHIRYTDNYAISSDFVIILAA
jgi:hypothetical protein